MGNELPTEQAQQGDCLVGLVPPLLPQGQQVNDTSSYYHAHGYSKCGIGVDVFLPTPYPIS